MKSHFLIKPSPSVLALLALGAMSVTSQLHAQSLSITGAIIETVGTVRTLNSDLPNSVTGGSAANTTSWAEGTVGVFQMNNGAYFMRVNAAIPTGTNALSPSGDSLMVIRTVNSQTLTDSGTLSVYVRPDPINGTVAETEWTLDLNFSFFSNAELTTPAPLNLLLTSLDIDFGQRYFVSNSTFSANYVSPTTGLVTPGTVPTGFTGYTTPGNSDSAIFDDPEHGVSSFGSGSSFDIRLGHQANGSNSAVALYMFEFRNPSQIVNLVPELSSSLLALGGLSMLGFMRRRQWAA